MQKSATMKVVNVGAKPLRDMGGLVQQKLMQNSICTDLRMLVCYLYHKKPLKENNEILFKFMHPFLLQVRRNSIVFSVGLVSGKCDMPITNAVDAGWLGISEETCLEKGMCWKKWNGPWCYKPYG